MSSSETGSRFRLTIPLLLVSGVREKQKTVLVPAQPPLEAATVLHTFPTLLIVDDIEDNRTLLQSILPNNEYNLVWAHDGVHAIAAFKEHKPDLVLMDIRMPGLDGFEATRQILGLPEGKNARIIAVSASAFEEDRERALAAGMVDFLRKPLEDAELRAALKRALGSESKGTKTRTSAVWQKLTADQLEDISTALETLSLTRIEAVLDRLENIDQDDLTEIRKRLDRFDHKFLLDEIAVLTDG